MSIRESTHQVDIGVSNTALVADSDLQQIREALRGLKFGSVNIVVQDGVVVQIDRTEKRRIRKGGNSQESGASRSG